MPSASIIIRDKNTGRVKLDSGTRNVLFFGVASIGGAGSPQDGSIGDARFYNGGTPVVFPLEDSFPGTAGLEAVFSFSGATLLWHYPAADGSTVSNRRPVTFLYGTASI